MQEATLICKLFAMSSTAITADFVSSVLETSTHVVAEAFMSKQAGKLVPGMTSMLLE